MVHVFLVNEGIVVIEKFIVSMRSTFPAWSDCLTDIHNDLGNSGHVKF